MGNRQLLKFKVKATMLLEATRCASHELSRFISSRNSMSHELS